MLIHLNDFQSTWLPSWWWIRFIQSAEGMRKKCEQRTVFFLSKLEWRFRLYRLLNPKRFFRAEELNEIRLHNHVKDALWDGTDCDDDTHRFRSIEFCLVKIKPLVAPKAIINFACSSILPETQFCLWHILDHWKLLLSEVVMPVKRNSLN